jgi:hypothetical protein
MLLERGITVTKGRRHIEESLPGILEDSDNKLSGALRVLLTELRLEMQYLSRQIEESDKSYKKQLIAPWAQSLVAETCRGAAVLERLGEDSVRRAKADFPLVPLCPVKSMAPVLAIAGMVARAVDTTAL